jgi:polygalacturonase
MRSHDCLVFGVTTIVVFMSTCPVASSENMMPTDPIAELKAPFPMPQLGRPEIPARSVDIRDFGAKPGEGQNNTAAIRRAIEECAGKGGGAVIVPKGEWYTGPIHLKSHINLHLQEGTSLRFLHDASLYLPPVRVRVLGFECYNFSPMIYAYQSTNIAITGKGKIYGPGHGVEDAKTHHRAWNRWRESQHRLGIADGVPTRESEIGKFTWRAGVHILQDISFKTNAIEERDVSGTYRLDPSLIQPVSCKNVLIEDIMIAQGGPMWTIHPTFCTNVIIRHIGIHTIGTAGDAIDVSSCENVLIERCDVAAGDDIVSLKSGLNQEGWRVNKPNRNIIIRNMNGMYAHAGGISIGSDLSGGAENVYCHDNNMNVPSPFRIKSRPGRGAVIRNVTCERFTVGKVGKRYTDWEFPEIEEYSPARELVELNNNYGVMEKRVDQSKATRLSGIVIRDFRATTVKAGIKVVSYKPDTYEGIVFENIRVDKVLRNKLVLRNASITLKEYVVAGEEVRLDKP